MISLGNIDTKKASVGSGEINIGSVGSVEVWSGEPEPLYRASLLGVTPSAGIGTSFHWTLTMKLSNFPQVGKKYDIRFVYSMSTYSAFTAYISYTGVGRERSTTSTSTELVWKDTLIDSGKPNFGINSNQSDTNLRSKFTKMDFYLYPPGTL